MIDSTVTHQIERACADNRCSVFVALVVFVAFDFMSPSLANSLDARSRLAHDLEHTEVQSAQVQKEGFVDIEIESGDVSVAVQFTTEDADAYVLVTAVRAPDGKLVYLNTARADDEEDGVVVSDMADSVFGQYGDAAFYLPLTPNHPLQLGSYRIFFDTESDAALDGVNVFYKIADGDIDKIPQTLDINVWLAHGDDEVTHASFHERVDVRFRETLDAMLLPHNMAVGKVKVYMAEPDNRRAYAILDEDDDMQAPNACGEMMSRVENLRALNVVYVETLVSKDGGSVGFSPLPGSVFNADAMNACVFIGDTAYIASPEEGLDQIMVDELHAVTLLHEGGHFMSLEHPSESGGVDFDHLADTPECDISTFDGREDDWSDEPGEPDGEISDYECGTAGGADNVMFWSGVIEYAPFHLTRDQAWVLRRHPLFASKEGP